MSLLMPAKYLDCSLGFVHLLVSEEACVFISGDYGKSSSSLLSWRSGEAWVTLKLVIALLLGWCSDTFEIFQRIWQIVRGRILQSATD